MEEKSKRSSENRFSDDLWLYPNGLEFVFHLTAQDVDVLSA